MTTGLSTAERELRAFLTGVRVQVEKSTHPSEWAYSGEYFWGMVNTVFELHQRFWRISSSPGCGQTTEFLKSGGGVSEFRTTACLGVVDGKHIHVICRWGQYSDRIHFEIEDVKFEDAQKNRQ